MMMKMKNMMMMVVRQGSGDDNDGNDVDEEYGDGCCEAWQSQ